MILGTAGHVDHGKTSLVRALTGIDTDRLPEEKKRGVTIELGFAHLALPGLGPVGVVDVPGHERFVKAMAAGAGGIDVVMLVVAADEGVMPQTREHVDICGLLGVRSGVVVITKADLLNDLGPAWRDLLEADLTALTQGTFLQAAPRVAVSAHTGEGLDALRTELGRRLQANERSRSSDGPFFMPLDRCFTMKGFGSVVTGTVLSGALRVDDEVALLPGLERPMRIRGLQQHGVAVERVVAGDRAAVNVLGLEADDVHRGMTLVRANELRAGSSLDVELTVLPSLPRPLPRRSRHVLTVGTSHVEAVVQLLEADALAPGQTGYARVRLVRPVAALAQQRFIIRGTHPVSGRGMTVAGGRVLALSPRRKNTPPLQALASAVVETRLTWLLTAAGPAGLTDVELFAALALPLAEVQRELETAAAQGRVVFVDQAPRRVVARDVFEALSQRALARVGAFHLASPERVGVPREELRQQLGLAHERTFHRLLAKLAEAKLVELTETTVALPGRGRRVDDPTERLQKRLAEAYANAGLAPPAPDLLASRLGLDTRAFNALAQALVAQGVLVKAGPHWFDAAAVKALEARLRAHFAAAPGPLTTQQFKELVGQSRKFAIPLAEYFDAQKVTLRQGELRTLRPTAVTRGP